VTVSLMLAEWNDIRDVRTLRRELLQLLGNLED